ncbi:hypothetical protein RUND412_002681 [Rhizina undulata]
MCSKKAYKVTRIRRAVPASLQHLLLVQTRLIVPAGARIHKIRKRAEKIVNVEYYIPISIILSPYFLSLKVLGTWRRGGAFRSPFCGLKKNLALRGGELVNQEDVDTKAANDDAEMGSDEDDEQLSEVVNSVTSGRNGYDGLTKEDGGEKVVGEENDPLLVDSPSRLRFSGNGDAAAHLERYFAH